MKVRYEIRKVFSFAIVISLLFCDKLIAINKVNHQHYDVVVYGATPGGVAAAVAAAREGVSVVLVQGDGHIGGLASGGLSNPDFRSFESLGGAYREFMQRVEQHYIDHYGVNSKQVINSVKGAYPEPSVARKVFENMLNEAGVQVLIKHRLISASSIVSSANRNAKKASFVNLDTGENIALEGSIFIDGTYEGDLMAALGVDYRVGREAKSEYNEELAANQEDHLVQAYNFRVVLTTNKENQIRIEKPQKYNRIDYIPLIDYIDNQNIKTIEDISRKILRIRRMPNGKAEFNDVRSAPLSLSRTGINNPWPDGDFHTRQSIFEEYKNWSLGLIYFLQNDEEVPIEIRSEMMKWALPADEYVDTNNWTPALYVREARRMVGSYVFTEHDTKLHESSVRSVLNKRSIAISDYSINTHGVLRNDGEEHKGVIGRTVRPLQIPFDVMLPKELDGLLVPVAVSASHVGFAALRYEPLWTALGQAAGVAAANAIANGIAVRDVNILELQQRLHELGALTIYVSDLGRETDVIRPDWEQPSENFRIWLNDVPPVSKIFKAVQFLGTMGFFHNLFDPATAKNWSAGRSTGQWALRMPYHTVDLNELVTQDLAKNWIELAIDLGLKPSIKWKKVVRKKMTRGELLLMIYDNYEKGKK